MRHGIHSCSCCQPGRQPFCHFRIKDSHIGEDIVIPEEQLPSFLMILDHRYISYLASCPGGRGDDNVWCLGSSENLKPCIILKFSSFLQDDCDSLCCIDGATASDTDEAIGSEILPELTPLIDNVDTRIG